MTSSIEDVEDAGAALLAVPTIIIVVPVAAALIRTMFLLPEPRAARWFHGFRRPTGLAIDGHELLKFTAV